MRTLYSSVVTATLLLAGCLATPPATEGSGALAAEASAPDVALPAPDPATPPATRIAAQEPPARRRTPALTTRPSPADDLPLDADACLRKPRREDGAITVETARCIARSHGVEHARVSGPRGPDGYQDEVEAIAGRRVYHVVSMPPAATRETTDFIDARSGAFHHGPTGPSLAPIRMHEATAR